MLTLPPVAPATGLAAGRFAVTTPERETVAALAAQVADLRHPVVQAGIANARLTADLGGRVDELADAIATALEDDGAIAPHAPYFLDMDEDQFRGEAQAVAAWVDGVLLPNYPGYSEGVIRPCWPHHPEALWELQRCGRNGGAPTTGASPTWPPRSAGTTAGCRACWHASASS